MPSTILGSQGIQLPADTTANRPGSPTTGMTRYNTSTKTTEFYNGTRWVSDGYLGDSQQNPASSAVELYNYGIRGRGFFWLTSPNGGVVRNFCDLDTADEDGVSGWILVAAFPTSSQWCRTGYSTRQTIDPYEIKHNENVNSEWVKKWSANWGDHTINKFRITNTDDIDALGANCQADWYYHYTTACKWKEVWNWKSGTGNYMNDTSGDNAGNINAPFHSGWPAPVNSDLVAVPRCCLRGFNWGYNIKFGYKNTNLRWNNLSDSANGGTSQTTVDFWTGLTQPSIALSWTAGGDDGSLAMSYQGSPATTTAHDNAAVSAKFGIDDGGESALFASSATQGMDQTGITGLRKSLYFWIK
jgi:hypothetical protein